MISKILRYLIFVLASIVIQIYFHFKLKHKFYIERALSLNSFAKLDNNNQLIRLQEKR